MYVILFTVFPSRPVSFAKATLSVRIVHGKGTGALRKGVHNYLKRQKHVASFRLGEFGEGDAGVTIVEFKK